MKKKTNKNSLQQIFLDSLEDEDSFKVIDGFNPIHIMLNGKEMYVYIKNLSPAYFQNPDVWRVQLPKKEEFEVIKNDIYDFVLLGYDTENDVYTTWNPKWTKQRLNNGESVSFYSRLSLQKMAAASKNIERKTLNNDGEVIAFSREYISLVLPHLKRFFNNDSDYVALGSKKRPDANAAYREFTSLKNVDAFARNMVDNGYSSTTAKNYQRAIRALINDGCISRNRKIFLSCNDLSEYTDRVSEFCDLPDVNERNESWHGTYSAALKAYIAYLISTDSSTKQSSLPKHNGTAEDKKDVVNTTKAVSTDWDSAYTDKNGKLTKIANPILIEMLRPILQVEYPKKIEAFNVIQDFYGERYSGMELYEWMNLFDNIEWDTAESKPQRISNTKTKEKKKKSKSEILRVEYPDGKVIQYNKVVETFVKVISDSYPDLISEMNIKHAGVNLVTKERSPKYGISQREIKDGWLVFTNITTKVKRTDLIRISDELELGLKVDLVPIEMEDTPPIKTGDLFDQLGERDSSSRRKIQVIFPDSRKIMPNKVLDALVDVVKYAGPKRVRDLNITVCDDNLILEHPRPRYVKASKPVGDGLFVNTCSDSKTKYDQIKRISDSLGLNLEVKLL